MSLDLSALPRLPGINHYLARLCQALARGCSVLSVMPNNLYTDSFWSICVNALWQENLDVEEIDLSEYSDGLSPAAFLLERYANHDFSGSDLSMLMTCHLPQIIALRGLESLERRARNNWLILFQEWATQTQRNITSPGYQPTGLWSTYALDEKQDHPLVEETWLQLFPWWSVVSALDIRMLCRLSDGIGQPSLPPYVAWRESLLGFLAGNDLVVMEQLWNLLDLPRQEIYDELLRVAEQRGWTAVKLERWGVLDYIKNWQRAPRRYVQTPARQEKSLWLRGLLFQTPEYGTQISSVALAVLQKWDLLEHLVWRGQAALLLPIIDEHRLSICQELTDKYGPSWAWQWSEPLSHDIKKELINNPLAAEWGHLVNSIRQSPYHQERKHLPSASLAHYIRNQLAHYRPVSYQDFEMLMIQIR